jgi:hypothetical protein
LAVAVVVLQVLNLSGIWFQQARGPYLVGLIFFLCGAVTVFLYASFRQRPPQSNLTALTNDQWLQETPPPPRSSQLAVKPGRPLPRFLYNRTTSSSRRRRSECGARTTPQVERMIMRHAKPWALSLVLAVSMLACSSGQGGGSTDRFEHANGLIVEVLEQGTDPAIEAGQTAVMHYTGWLDTGGWARVGIRGSPRTAALPGCA